MATDSQRPMFVRLVRSALDVAASIAIVVVASAPVCLAAFPQARSRTDPTISQILAAGAKYVEEYEKQFSAVISEERYEQSWTPLGSRIVQRRLLRSDLIVMNAGKAGWISFRDVFEVDGAPVRGHDNRLIKLVTDLTADSFAQARRVAEESSRFQLGGVARTINTPTLALMFLRREYQNRSTFSFEGMKTVDGRRVALLSFKEEGMPRLVNSIDGAASEGQFWIEPSSGRVLQTEFALNSSGSSARIAVRYANQARIGLWLPVRMDETIIAHGSGTGRADYTNFRRFNVNVTTVIKHDIP